MSEIAETLRLFEPEAPLCAGCDLRTHCGAANGPDACPSRWGDAASGGPNVHHVLNTETLAHFEDVGGPSLSSLRFPGVDRCSIPPLSHWIRPRRELRARELTEDCYVVGLDAVVGRRHVLPADELRGIADLWSGQSLVLALFGNDEDLERLWAARARIIREIAAAGYDYVLAPSYSIYDRRPASEWLLHSKRSYWFAAELQQAGVRAVPRAGWNRRWQMIREAEVFRSNPQLEAIALDIATLRPDAWWQGQVRLLEGFDRLTGQRLTFIVNGPGTAERILDLYRALSAARTRLLSSRRIAYWSLGSDVDRDFARARTAWNIATPPAAELRARPLRRTRMPARTGSPAVAPGAVAA